MTAEPPGSPVTEGACSLEVRWIFPGQLETAVAGWFGRFPARTESREDTYLLDPQLPGLSVKVARRLGAGGEGVPRQPGDPGGGGPRPRTHAVLAEVVLSLHPARPGTAPARPAGGRYARGGASPGSRCPADSVRHAPRSLARQPRCEVELTEVRSSGQDWWTLGFEATGPAGLLRGELQATVALVFAQALPGGVEPGPDESRSYAEWLGQLPGADSHAVA